MVDLPRHPGLHKRQGTENWQYRLMSPAQLHKPGRPVVVLTNLGAPDRKLAESIYPVVHAGHVVRIDQWENEDAGLIVASPPGAGNNAAHRRDDHPCRSGGHEHANPGEAGSDGIECGAAVQEAGGDGGCNVGIDVRAPGRANRASLRLLIGLAWGSSIGPSLGA